MKNLDALDIARFWSKVDVRPDELECWNWKAGTDGYGYGQFKLSSAQKTLLSHRVAFSLIAGIGLAELEGLVTRHKCDNPSCCNPFHLETGSHADNVRDRVSRQRSAKGEGNGHHVLTEQQVRAIRADQRSNSAIAREYGVHTDTVRLIRIGKTWRHLFTENQAAAQPISDDQ